MLGESEEHAQRGFQGLQDHCIILRHAHIDDGHHLTVHLKSIGFQLDIRIVHIEEVEDVGFQHVVWAPPGLTTVGVHSTVTNLECIAVLVVRQDFQHLVCVVIGLVELESEEVGSESHCWEGEKRVWETEEAAEGYSTHKKS